jgi:acyl carrier protein
MLPTYFVRLDRLPLSSNGKIDRHALPAPSHENTQPAHDFVPAQTETQKALAALWSELLNVPNLGINDDFFNLGGQSLVAIRALSRIRDVFDVELSLRNLFEHPTVAGLAEVIDRMAWLAKGNMPTAEARDREEVAL